jgi:hypothetical protein
LPRIAFRATFIYSVAMARPVLTPDLCQNIVVNATPNQTPNDATQNLFALGVVDGTSAQIHKAKIQAALHLIEYRIAQGEILSGPTVTVDSCTQSVLASAQ